MGQTIKRARVAGLSWAEVEGMTDDELEERLYGLPRRPTHNRPKPDPVWIHTERKRVGVTLELLHLEYLEQHPGFVGKQVWTDRERAGQIHCVITWADQASWDAIPAADVERVDAEMGEWYRPCTMRTFDVVRTC